MTERQTKSKTHNDGYQDGRTITVNCTHTQ